MNHYCVEYVMRNGNKYMEKFASTSAEQAYRRIILMIGKSSGFRIVINPYDNEHSCLRNSEISEFRVIEWEKRFGDR